MTTPQGDTVFMILHPAGVWCSLGRVRRLYGGGVAGAAALSRQRQQLPAAQRAYAGRPRVSLTSNGTCQQHSVVCACCVQPHVCTEGQILRGPALVACATDSSAAPGIGAQHVVVGSEAGVALGSRASAAGRVPTGETRRTEQDVKPCT